MVEYTAFRLVRAVALFLGVAAVAALSGPAAAKPSHRHHASARHHHHHASSHHYSRSHAAYGRSRRAAPSMEFGQAGFGFVPNYQADNQANYQSSYQPSHQSGFQQASGYADPVQQAAPRRGRRHARPAMQPQMQTMQQPEAQSWGGGGSSIVAAARSYIGGNPTGRSSLWCARFMNLVLQRSGLRGTGSDMASSFAHYGQRISGPQVGAIAVMARRGGGHVGVVSGIDSSGNPIVVSGNHNHRVAESVYSKSRIYAYVMPTS